MLHAMTLGSARAPRVCGVDRVPLNPLAAAILLFVLLFVAATVNASTRVSCDSSIGPVRLHTVHRYAAGATPSSPQLEFGLVWHLEVRGDGISGYWLATYPSVASLLS